MLLKQLGKIKIYQGSLRWLLLRYKFLFSNPEYWYIDKVMNTGDFPKHEKVQLNNDLYVTFLE